MNVVMNGPAVTPEEPDDFDPTAWARPDACRYATQNYDPFDDEERLRCERAYMQCREDAEETLRYYGFDPNGRYSAVLEELIACADVHGYCYGINPINDQGDLAQQLLTLASLGMVGVTWKISVDGPRARRAQRFKLGWPRETVGDPRLRQLRANGGSHTRAEWSALLRLFDYRCARCGTPDEESPLTKDHVTPVVKGGTDDIGNIAPLCHPCNSVKGTKTTDYRPSALARLGKSEVQP